MAATAVVVPGCERPPPQAANPRPPYLFFNAEDAAFVEAAVARLIPADDAGPGALEAEVPAYIDRQLAGAWGAGGRMYRSGPWLAGTPEQGYQLPFTPAELFKNSLRAIAADVGKSNRGKLSKLEPQEQDAYLRSLENEPRDLGGVPSDVFFQLLLDMTVEGFFADPVYGGNKDMVGWKLVGFPGAYANYYEFVDQHGIRFTRPPMSLGQDAGGTVHLHPVSSPPAAAKGR
ncbi:gluconate 2-dehydrogenase subunit 3 family protein [Ramlibacter tataouinensis]|uniref:gluconate 2-dehydrogenase subunit 3 family protein n=1 Tax=Ramlibacter tataouinensis TaxID=94132 RepID=UPI00221FBCD1|nr:gluconate 2-dehydrogenase subunit 3 family protein [Ramlibacter tataouinensis]